MKTTNKAIYVFCLISVLILCLSVAGPGMAQVPKKINYQGYLQDSLTGEPITGTVQMEFALYDVPTGGSPLWSETQQVEVDEGRYSVHLGAVVPLNFIETKPYYLMVSIDGEVLTDDNGMEYREELTSGLYTLFSGTIDFPIRLWPHPEYIDENTFYGVGAGDNTTGKQNTFIGHEAGLWNTEGHSNTFVGDDAGRANIEGRWNTFLGHNAGGTNTKGGHNTFVGNAAGLGNTTGSHNTFLGNQAGEISKWSTCNTFLGYNAGRANTSSAGNTFVGCMAGEMSWKGHYNTFLGSYAGYSNMNDYNTFVGLSAGANNEGSGNVFLGNMACRDKNDFSNKLCIHNSESPLPLIYGGFAARFVRIHGDLEHTGSLSHVSDQRLKDVQQAFTSGLEAIEQLQPVSYRYKPENPLHLPSERSYVGVVAQEVQQVIPEAVEEGEDGYLMVNNDPIIWTMLNAIKELKAQNEALKTQNEVLENTLKTQNEMIMKEIELLKKALGQ